MSAFVLNRKYELALPTSYVDVDNEEMEYIDGGFSWNDAKYAVYGAMGYLVGQIVGHAVNTSLVGAAIRAAGGWLASAIDTAIIAAYCHPVAALASVAAIGGGAYLVYKIGKNKGYW